jgi:hypothetical protein
VKHILYILTFLFFASCGRGDDFSSVTKLIDIQDTIIVNHPFDIRLILRNDSLNEMEFTIDDTFQKSLFFNLDFRCDDQLIKSNVENPKKQKHIYHKYYLKKGDSLIYQLSGLYRQVNNTLQMEISGYERIYIIENINCNNLTIDFDGMWIPGDFNPFDAMEGYNFGKKIFVKFGATETHRQ